jgi:hypothetical protein
MNIVTRLAIIEQLLEEATLESSHELDTRSVRQSDASGQQLVDELDQAQMLKAASHLRPSRHASA